MFFSKACQWSVLAAGHRHMHFPTKVVMTGGIARAAQFIEIRHTIEELGLEVAKATEAGQMMGLRERTRRISKLSHLTKLGDTENVTEKHKTGRNK